MMFSPILNCLMLAFSFGETGKTSHCFHLRLCFLCVYMCFIKSPWYGVQGNWNYWFWNEMYLTVLGIDIKFLVASEWGLQGWPLWSPRHNGESEQVAGWEFSCWQRLT